MKTLVRDGKSLYIFENDEFVVLYSDKIVVGDPEKFIIGDCNKLNTTLYEDVTPPEDWCVNRYVFDGVNWTVNPDWPADAFEWDGTSWNLVN